MDSKTSSLIGKCKCRLSTTVMGPVRNRQIFLEPTALLYRGTPMHFRFDDCLCYVFYGPIQTWIEDATDDAWKDEKEKRRDFEVGGEYYASLGVRHVLRR